MSTRDTNRTVDSAKQMGAMSAPFVSLLERMSLAEDACLAAHAEGDRLLSKASDPLSLAQARLAEKRARQDLEVIINEIVDKPAEYVGDVLIKFHLWKDATFGPNPDMDLISPMERVALSAVRDLDKLLT